MGVEVYFAVEGQDEPVEGDQVASLLGWSQFSAYGASLDPDDFPAVVRLAVLGEGWPLDELEDELRRLAKKPPGNPSADVRGVTARLLEVLGEKPEKSEGIVISDGEPGEDADGEEEDEDQ
jgi:hypothetical protein